jgi:hypothetical protein
MSKAIIVHPLPNIVSGIALPSVRSNVRRLTRVMVGVGQSLLQGPWILYCREGLTC